MDSVNNAVSGEFDPGRVGATVSPEPQADSSCKRISGPNVTPAGPESNLPNDDNDDGLPSHDGLGLTSCFGPACVDDARGGTENTPNSEAPDSAAASADGNASSPSSPS